MSDDQEIIGGIFCGLFIIALLACLVIMSRYDAAIDNLEDDYKQAHYERALRESSNDRAKTEMLLADELQEIKDRERK